MIPHPVSSWSFLVLAFQLAADPLSADVIYAGSAGQGLFRLEGGVGG